MSEVLRPLIEAVKAGDRDALEELAGCVDRFVRIFHGSVSNTVRLRYGSTVDFVCEGVAESLDKLADFEYRSDEEFYGWVARFIKNRIRGVGREARSQKRGERPARLAAIGDQVPADGPGAATLAHSADVREAVGSAILELQREYPHEMDVVIRKIFEEQSWPQIKDALQLSSDKRARTLFVHGLERLRAPVERRLGTGTFEKLMGQ